MKKLLLSVCIMPMLAFAQAVLPTSWDFGNPPIGNPPEGWSHNLGTGNLTYASGVGDGVSIRLDQTGEWLQIQFAEKPGPLSYYIRSQYANNPGFTGVFSVQESTDGSVWNNIRQFTDGQLGSSLTRYQHNLAATTRFVRFFYTDKQSGSNVQMDSVMIKLPPPPAQGIVLQQNNNVLLNGGQFAFGNASTKKFHIQNIGVSEDLKIDSIIISGTNASDFSISAFDSIVPFNNGLDSFDVNFSAGANGSRFATLKVYSTDTEKNPFTINLYAIGGNFATEPAAQVAKVNISNVRTYTMNVSFPRAANTEKYIVLRKNGAPVNETPVDGTTYKRGDYIGSAQVAYIGDDTTLLKPNYILANSFYSFAVFPFNGTEGYENYKTDAFARDTATTLANQIGNYYASINPNSASFVTDLKNRLATPHDTVYYGYYIGTLINNYLARDTTDGKKVVNCVYTGAPYIYDEPFLWRTGSTGPTLTREHTFCQSWMAGTGVVTGYPDNVGGKEVLEYNDLHHLFPAHHDNANGKRSNHPLGIVTNATYTAPTGVGKLGTDANGKTVYEPRDEHKGDAARAILYILTRYNGDRNLQWRLPASQDLDVLLQWHQQDPPDALEIARNEYIYSVQKNRNPFIDNPSWVDRINFSNMTYVPDPSAEFVVLNSPNGGQTYQAGTTQNIIWSSQNVDTVVIEYRQSATANWELITDTVPATRGTYQWTIPNIETATALVRIFGKGDTTVGDTSNAIFTINPIRTLRFFDGAAPILIEPPSGILYPLFWEASFVDSVKIELLIKDTLHSVIVESCPARNEKYIWKVPYMITDSVRFRISNSKYNLVDTSDFYYRINHPNGIAENNSLNNYISVYPVPSKGAVNVAAAGNIQIEHIKVYDIAGRLLQTTSETKLNLPNTGLYFIHIATDKGTAVKKVIIE